MTVGQGPQSGIVQRMIRAARLEDALYEEVEHDRSATRQAALVVVVTSIAAGIGGAVELGFLGLIGLTVAALVGWLLYASLTYLVGTRLLAGPETRSDWFEVARTLGFANTPRVFLILGVVPVLAGVVALVVFVWVLITTVIALRAALDFSTGRAIGTAVIGWVVQILILGTVYALFAS
jgi:hypothetical protein